MGMGQELRRLGFAVPAGPFTDRGVGFGGQFCSTDRSFAGL